MRRVGDLMAELGFRSDAPEGAQRAFLKNLVRAAYGADVTPINEFKKAREKNFPLPQPEKSEEKKIVANGPVQLSFQFDESEG